LRWIARNRVAASEIDAIVIRRGSSQTLAAHAAGRGGARQREQPAVSALDGAELTFEFVDTPFGR